MKKARLVLLSCLLFGAGTKAISQAAADAIAHPTVIPPSPEAQAFAKYGEYPVDYSTGVPKIDLPIYEIKSGKLSLPISISYHASGIRVNDVASVVGLGWRLNAGGGLTRTVKGRPDENSEGILRHLHPTKTQIDNTTPSSIMFYDLLRSSRGAKDNESDNYFYSAGNNLSGQFVYDHLLNLTALSASDDEIIRHDNPGNLPPGYWYEVVGSDGTRYIFDRREATIFDAESYPSTWWLSKIVSADGTDIITFEYETSINYYNDKQISHSWQYDINSANGGSSGSMISASSSINYPVYLKKIKFKEGYISFDYAEDRLDVRDTRLAAISIYKGTEVAPLKKYQFVQSYFYSGYANNKYNYRLKLDALNVYDANGVLSGYNTFSYNEDKILPPYFGGTDAFQHPSYAVDFWGYYNGQLQNHHLIPYLRSPDIAANRTPNETFAKACILNKITYPTGGYTSFEYKSNVTGEQFGAPEISGGLRIYRIISKADDASTPVIKRYEYTNDMLYIDMDAYGKYSYLQNITWVNTSNCISYMSNSTIYVSNPIVSLQNHNGSPVLYQIVDEYTDGIAGSLKTTYTYEAQRDIVYPVISERYQNQHFLDRSWRRGLLGGVFHYKLVNGKYELVKSTSNVYDDYRAKRIVTGTLVQEKNQRPSTACGGDGYALGAPMSSYFYYFDDSIEVGAMKLVREYNVEKDKDGNVIVTTKNFTYSSPDHGFPTDVYYNNSHGDERKTQMKYPHDFAGIAVYDAMIGKHIISPVIEQQKYKNNSFLESTKTNYNFWGTSLIEPQTVETKTFNNAGEIRLRFHSYDNEGNITSVSKENDVKIVYVWGYNNTYPVAEVTGASYNDVIGVLNQSILQNPSDDQALRTELNKIRVNFPIALVKTFTYKPLIGITSQTDAGNHTTYYEYDAFGRLVLVRDQDGNAIKKICYNYAGQPENCTGAPIYINAATVGRFTKQGCSTGYSGSVVSYGVAPGKYTSTISQADADQKAMDEVNANGQSHANAVGTCTPTVYYNVAKSGYFVRQNCGAGYTGGGYVYSVPAEKYSSLISQAYVDQLAQNEVDANGQAGANQYGACNPIPTIVDVKNSNFTSKTFTATFTNTSTGTVYQYTLGPSGGGVLLGQIPVGTYNITINVTPAGGSELYEFYIGSAHQAGIHSFSASDVYLDYSGTIEISDY
ncbi:DUF5977 domain-containing protein [Niastella caeni]|nr:DUF5977 domain-containing protein [Niastella caeni]